MYMIGKGFTSFGCVLLGDGLLAQTASIVLFGEDQCLQRATHPT